MKCVHDDAFVETALVGGRRWDDAALQGSGSHPGRQARIIEEMWLVREHSHVSPLIKFLNIQSGLIFQPRRQKKRLEIPGG
jgi:hypothetical protein